MELLQSLLQIPSLSGDERGMRDFLIGYFKKNEKNFRTSPRLIYGEEYQNCLAVIFGQPRTAVFAHIDTVGFMVRYGNELIEIGSPDSETGMILSGEDKNGPVECKILVEPGEYEDQLFYTYDREIERGTELYFKPNFRAQEAFIQSPYLDNRIGIWNALRLAEELEDGILVFSCWEEHNGGSAAYMGRLIYEQFNVRQALVSDITWTTHGVQHEKGAVISLRDSGIPRRDYVKRIMAMADESGIPYQVEVEKTGGSDGNELQKLPYPIDWCFVGAPCSHMHTPDEVVYRQDIEAMHGLYRWLMPRL